MLPKCHFGPDPRKQGSTNEVRIGPFFGPFFGPFSDPFSDQKSDPFLDQKSVQKVVQNLDWVPEVTLRS